MTYKRDKGKTATPDAVFPFMCAYTLIYMQRPYKQKAHTCQAITFSV